MLRKMEKVRADPIAIQIYIRGQITDFFLRDLDKQPEIFRPLIELRDAASFGRISPRRISELLNIDSGDADELVRTWIAQREEIEKMAVFIKKYDLPTMWFFLFGGPGENEGTVNETLDFIHRFVNSEDLVYMAAGLRIYPDTPLEKIALMDKCITEGQSLLYPQKFYYSKEIAREYLAQRIMETSLKWHNCLPSSETRASPGMLQEAQKRRELLGLKEPMFRTLLRIRKEWMDKGLL